MKLKNLITLLMFVLPSFAFAGEIYGTLKKDGKPLAKQEIKITQNSAVIGTAVTDENGYYSIVIKPIGKCKLEVPGYAGAEFEVFSTNNSTDYTLSLVKVGDVWQLKKQ